MLDVHVHEYWYVKCAYLHIYLCENVLTNRPVHGTVDLGIHSLTHSFAK